MGKIVSVIQFTGRTGNLVGSKGQNGTVVLKNHQPNVTNRNTQEQVNARVKLALAGSLSKIVPADTIYGCQVVNLYSVPIKLATSLAGHAYGNEVIAVGDSTSAYSIEAKSYNSGAYVWMHSQYIGSYSA